MTRHPGHQHSRACKPARRRRAPRRALQSFSATVSRQPEQPSTSQFGWQFETQITGLGNGLTAVNELVVLAGGMDQGTMIPSASWLVGLRTREGTEFGVGPNLTPAGVALALAAGVTIKTGALNIPINIAVVPSKAGTRISFLTGFNIRTR